MKLHVAFVLLLVCAAFAQEALDDGQPDCSTDLQMLIKNFKHKTNPSSYWICEKLGQPATLASCPEGAVFFFSLQKCVKSGVLNWQKPSLVIPKPEDLIDRIPLRKLQSA